MASRKASRTEESTSMVVAVVVLEQRKALEPDMVAAVVVLGPDMGVELEQDIVEPEQGKAGYELELL